MTWTMKFDNGKPINWPERGGLSAESGTPRSGTGLDLPRIGSFGLVAFLCQSLALDASCPSHVSGRRAARGDTGERKRTKRRAGGGRGEDHPDQEPRPGRSVNGTTPRDHGADRRTNRLESVTRVWAGEAPGGTHPTLPPAFVIASASMPAEETAKTRTLVQTRRFHFGMSSMSMRPFRTRNTKKQIICACRPEYVRKTGEGVTLLRKPISTGFAHRREC